MDKPEYVYLQFHGNREIWYIQYDVPLFLPDTAFCLKPDELIKNGITITAYHTTIEKYLELKGYEELDYSDKTEQFQKIIHFKKKIPIKAKPIWKFWQRKSHSNVKVKP